MVSQPMTHTSYRKAAAFALGSIFLLTILRTAWISDDAMITMRTVLNFEHGYGLRFNIDERVQAYTHPLWMFVLAAFSSLTSNIYTGTFAASILTSLLAYWLLLCRLGGLRGGAIVAGLALLLSKAYIDYATSGLENPLSHVLLIVSVLLAIRIDRAPDTRTLALFFGVVSLAYLTRPDALVLVFPLSLWVLYRCRYLPLKHVARSVVIGGLPAILWTLFSTWYYGFPFPNTAYAKLGTGIEWSERVRQGIRYLIQSADHDPLTLTVILAGLALGFTRDAVSRAISLGILLHIAYLLNIGGDFMEGRFLTVPLMAAAISIARQDLDFRGMSVVCGGVLLMGSASFKSTVLSTSEFDIPEVRANGISDERGYYFQKHGLLPALAGYEAPGKAFRFNQPDWTAYEYRVQPTCQLGALGLKSGPHVHLVDECALSDPLLARMPAKVNRHWRIGHFYRQFPTDYLKSLELRSNEIKDPAMRQYYEYIRLVTRGPLNHPARLKAIVKLNAGRVPLPDMEPYRTAFVPRVSGSQTATYRHLPKELSGSTWDSAANTQFSTNLDIQVEPPIPADWIDLSLSRDGAAEYAIYTLRQGAWQELARIPAQDSKGMGIHRIRAATSQDAPISAVRISVVQGDGRYALGHLRLD